MEYVAKHGQHELNSITEDSSGEYSDNFKITFGEYRLTDEVYSRHPCCQYLWYVDDYEYTTYYVYSNSKLYCIMQDRFFSDFYNTDRKTLKELLISKEIDINRIDSIIEVKKDLTTDCIVSEDYSDEWNFVDTIEYTINYIDFTI